MKKIISLMLCCALILTFFVGCVKSSENESTTENINPSEVIKFTFDSHYSTLDQSAIRAYEKVANAIVSGEDSAAFNCDMIDSVNILLHTGFPLISLVESIEVNQQNNGVTIKYKNDKTKHKQLVNDFCTKISAIENQCKLGQVGSNEYLLNVYNYVATHTTYDNSVTDTYQTIMSSKGMSASISGMFEYLLLQGGVSANHIVGVDAAGNYWFFSRAMFCGKMYNFDPSTELSTRKGEGLTCFAMTDKETVATGLQNKFSYSDKTKADNISIKDSKFSVLRSCAYYELNENSLKAFLFSGDSKLIELS